MKMLALVLEMGTLQKRVEAGKAGMKGLDSDSAWRIHKTKQLISGRPHTI
jgi:hypothetical protein